MEGNGANVRHPMGDMRGDEMDAANGHWFHPRPPTLIHQDEGPYASNSSVVFRAVAFQMKMAVRHEVLGANFPRFDNSASPKKRAFSALGYRAPSLHAIRHSFWVHPAPRNCIGKNTLQLRQGSDTFVNFGAGLKKTARPIYLYHRLPRLVSGRSLATSSTLGKESCYVLGSGCVTTIGRYKFILLVMSLVWVELQAYVNKI